MWPTVTVSEHHDQKQVREERDYVLFGLHIPTVVHHWRESGKELKQGWNLEPGADAEEYCLLAFSSCFLIELKSTIQGDPTYNWLGAYTSINN